MTQIRPGARNLITDIAGLRVGNAHDHTIKSGVTALICDQPATAGVQVLGGAPGTRETDLLEPHNSVQQIDALVLSGGSAFGLDAASGVQDHLRAQGRGFAVGPHTVPIVPAAILFDLINGGKKDWAQNPYRALGREAADCVGEQFALGSVGAGTGCLTATIKGGLGSASSYLPAYDITVGALVAVNALGSPLIGKTTHFWAAPFEHGSEFGGLGMPAPWPADAQDLRIKFRDQSGASSPQNTTIGIIATDAALSKAQCKRLAIAAHDGYARALWPAHTPLDGDLVFGLSTAQRDTSDSLDFAIDLSAAAASTMARAIARGVYAASQSDGDMLPAWSTRN